MSKATAAKAEPETKPAAIAETAAPLTPAAKPAPIAADAASAYAEQLAAGGGALPPIPQNCWALKEYQNPGGWVCLPKGYTVEHLLEPACWANVAGKMRAYSTVEVHWADASQFAEFYVLDCGRNWASVELLRHHELGKARKRPNEHNFQVGYNGPVDKFRVVNVTNNTVLQAGFATELDARRFLAEHLKKIQ